MNSLYPDSNESVTSDFPVVVPDPKQTKAEIDYLIEVFRTQTECFKKTGRSSESNVPRDFQPDFPERDK